MYVYVYVYVKNMYKNMYICMYMKKYVHMYVCVSKPQCRKLLYKSQQTAPTVSQSVSRPQWKKLSKSTMQFLCTSS